LKPLFVNGIGVVSPAGWGVEPFRDALHNGQVAPTACVQRPGWTKPLACRRVPPPNPAPAFLSHGRLRRTTSITSFAASAVLQAIADAKANPQTDRIGIILCVLAGCIQFTRRFYHEAWHDPSTASPLVFAETVFNAPSSHIAAVLPSAAINYTLLGDSSGFLEGIAMAADWLEQDLVDGCVIVGSEEIDWPTLDAFQLFSPQLLCSEGAGAVYVSNRPASVEVTAITEPRLYSDRRTRIESVKEIREQVGEAFGLRSRPIGTAFPSGTHLCDSKVGVPRYDAPDETAWQNWPGPRTSPKQILGEAMMAGAAWQCVAATDTLRSRAANASIVTISGCLQQAGAAVFSIPTN
jgi:hypothetical protein